MAVSSFLPASVQCSQACYADVRLDGIFAVDPQHSVPGQGQMNPEQIGTARLNREGIRLEAGQDIQKSDRSPQANEFIGK